jgi:hypothetical protein
VSGECHYGLWLNCDLREVAEQASVLGPYSGGTMRAFTVGLTANDPRNDGPESLASAV